MIRGSDYIIIASGGGTVEQDRVLLSKKPPFTGVLGASF